MRTSKSESLPSFTVQDLAKTYQAFIHMHQGLATPDDWHFWSRLNGFRAPGWDKNKNGILIAKGTH